jgi:hypothetical protein
MLKSWQLESQISTTQVNIHTGLKPLPNKNHTEPQKQGLLGLIFATWWQNWLHNKKYSLVA